MSKRVTEAKVQDWLRRMEHANRLSAGVHGEVSECVDGVNENDPSVMNLLGVLSDPMISTDEAIGHLEALLDELDDAALSNSERTDG